MFIFLFFCSNSIMKDFLCPSMFFVFYFLVLFHLHNSCMFIFRVVLVLPRPGSFFRFLNHNSKSIFTTIFTHICASFITLLVLVLTSPCPSQQTTVINNRSSLHSLSLSFLLYVLPRRHKWLIFITLSIFVLSSPCPSPLSEPIDLHYALHPCPFFSLSFPHLIKQ